MIKADYHIHTAYCGHARGSVDEYARAAIQLGMDEICFTDHLHRYYLPPEVRREYWDWGMREESLESYVKEVRKAQEQYSEVRIRLGVEADYVEGCEDELSKVLAQYPFDHVLASIHCLPPLGYHHIAEYQSEDPYTVYEMFFRLLTAAAGTGLFTCAAHPDFIWRYFPWPEERTAEILEGMDGFIRAVAARENMSVEANANAVLWMVDKPEFEKGLFKTFFEMTVRHGVPVTLGSDAHRPLQIAAAFGELTERLREAGVRKVALFRQRKMETHPINK